MSLNHDIAPDGSRFVTVIPNTRGETSTSNEIVLVQNWFQELTERVPVP